MGGVTRSHTRRQEVSWPWPRTSLQPNHRWFSPQGLAQEEQPQAQKKALRCLTLYVTASLCILCRTFNLYSTNRFFSTRSGSQKLLSCVIFIFLYVGRNILLT